jgi:hypothetical protein
MIRKLPRAFARLPRLTQALWVFAVMQALLLALRALA